MKDDHELDELLRELYKPDPAAVDRVIAAALSPRNRQNRLRSRVSRFAMVAVGILACVILLARFFAHSPKTPELITTNQPAIAKASDQELLRWVDGLVGKDIPSALEPARLVTREMLKGEK